MIASKSRGTTFQKLFVKSARQSAPQFAHSCPYFGDHTVENAVMPKDVVQIFPHGQYRLVITYADKIDKNVASIIAFFDVFEF